MNMKAFEHKQLNFRMAMGSGRTEVWAIVVTHINTVNFRLSGSPLFRSLEVRTEVSGT